MKSLRLTLFAGVPALLLSGRMLTHGGRWRPSNAICPVSGDELKVKADTPSMTWKGQHLYFASEEHLKRFAAAPDSFKAPAPAPASGSRGGH